MNCQQVLLPMKMRKVNLRPSVSKLCITFFHKSNCGKINPFVKNGKSTSCLNKISKSWFKKIKSRKHKFFSSVVTKREVKQDNYDLFQHNVSKNNELSIEFFPPELLMMIFYRVDDQLWLAFGSLSNSRHSTKSPRFVCQKWNAILSSIEFWQKYHKYWNNRLPEKTLEEYWSWQVYANLRMDAKLFGTNLIKNPSGESTTPIEIMLQNPIEFTPSYPNWRILNPYDEENVPGAVEKQCTSWLVKELVDNNIPENRDATISSHAQNPMLKSFLGFQHEKSKDNILIPHSKELTFSRYFQINWSDIYRVRTGKDQIIDLHKFFLVSEFSIFEIGQKFKITIQQWYRFTHGPFHLDIKVAFYNENKELLKQYPADNQVCDGDTYLGTCTSSINTDENWQLYNYQFSSSLKNVRYIRFYHGGVPYETDYNYDIMLKESLENGDEEFGISLAKATLMIECL